MIGKEVATKVFKTVHPQRTNQVIREAFIAKHLVKNRQKHIRILPSIYNGKWQKMAKNFNKNTS